MNNDFASDRMVFASVMVENVTVVWKIPSESQDNLG